VQRWGLQIFSGGREMILPKMILDACMSVSRLCVQHFVFGALGPSPVSFEFVVNQTPPPPLH